MISVPSELIKRKQLEYLYYLKPGSEIQVVLRDDVN
jgi:hypothetical protein